METIFTRRSIREFSDQPIDKKILEQLVRAAMQAPSAVNQQPWRFWVLSKRETLNHLAETLPHAKMLKTAAAAVLVVTDKSNMLRDKMYPQDQSAATQNILLEAANHGIGSCWIGIHPNEEKMEMLKGLFELPAEYEPFSLIALGYPAREGMIRFVDRYNPVKVHFEE